MAEVYYSGDVSRAAYAFTEQPSDLYAELQAVFPWARREQYFSISEPSFHEVLQERVITCNLPYPQCELIAGADAGLAARKFCMDSQTSFLRVYKLPTGPAPSWMPEGVTVMAIGENYEEFGRPFNPVAKTFTDFYFGGNPDVIEPHFNLERRRGSYDTWYGATVVDGSVVRVKQYCYESQGVFSDWEVLFMTVCKRHDRLDLLESGSPT